VFCRLPDAAFEILTSAPEITAPVTSVTVPDKEVVLVCAKSDGEHSIIDSATIRTVRNLIRRVCMYILQEMVRKTGAFIVAFLLAPFVCNLINRSSSEILSLWLTIFRYTSGRSSQWTVVEKC
jgi:hypothetical protein